MSKKPRENQPPESLDAKNQQLWVWLVSVLLVLAVFAVFGQTVNHEFILCDDNIYIGNPNVYHGLTRDGFNWACTTTFAGNWHPLTWLSHMLDVQIFGLWAGGHHLVNVLLHAASAVLLFLALRLMTGAIWRSALVAAMFAIHPLRAESVAWAAERKDVLSGMFWMLTLLSYAWYVRKPGIGRYLAIFASLALGLSAKSMLVTLPCVLLLLDYWPLGRWRWESDPGEDGEDNVPLPSERPDFPSLPRWWLVVEKLPLFALSAAVSAGIVYAQKSSGAMNMATPIPFGSRVANALVSCVQYLWMTIWPENLAFFYPHPAILGKDPIWWTVGQAVAAGLILAAITGFVVWNVRRRPYLSVGWFWYLGTLVPVIGLIQVGIQAMADRYTYIPTIGIYILTVWGAVEFSKSHARFREALLYVAPMLLVLWIVLAGVQVSTWKNSFTVFKHAIDVTKDNYFAHNHYGLAFDTMGDIKTAGAEYQIAVDLAPDYDSANSNLGTYFMKTGKLDQAVACFENAVRVNPYFYGARANLGSAYQQQNRFDDAIAELREAIRLFPEDAQFHGALAMSLYRKGTPEKTLDEAISEARTAIGLLPTKPEYHGLLATCLIRKGKPHEALAEEREALRLNPNGIAALNELAATLATSPESSIRDGDEAVQLAKQAESLSRGQDPDILRTLAAAYAEAGHFSEAQQTARRGCDLAVQQKKQALADSFKNDLRKYESGQTFRQTRP